MSDEQLERAMNKWKVMKQRKPNASELRGQPARPQQAEHENTDGSAEEVCDSCSCKL